MRTSILLTCLYLAAMVHVACSSGEPPRLGDWGSAFSGAAFIWLVYGYWLQAKQIREGRSDIDRQHDAMVKQGAAIQQTAETLRSMTNLYKMESARAEMRLREEREAALPQFQISVVGSWDAIVRWWTLELRIRNDGEDCRITGVFVREFLQNTPGEVKIDSQEIREVAMGREVALGFSTPNAGAAVLVVVSYRDALGRPGVYTEALRPKGFEKWIRFSPRWSA